MKRLKHKQSCKDYAGKFIRKKRSKAGRRGVLREDIEREVVILNDIDHDNIVKIVEVFESNHEVILVLEL